MKNTIYLLIFILLLIAISIFFYKKSQKYQNLYLKELQNVEAYQSQNDSLNSTNKQFVLTIGQLKNSNDSLDTRILSLTKELKIKTKNIQQITYSKDVIVKTDTIIFQDTIFRDNIELDTLLQDSWYKLNVQIKHPKSIIVTPTFTSEKLVIVNTSKEYNKPKSKWWIKRIFQKKHTVINVTVEEKNPYIENKQFKMIKII